MTSQTEETEPQPMLLRLSPSRNNVISWPSSPGVDNVSSHLQFYRQPPAQVRANDDLLIVAQLICHPAQLQNISVIAVATLLNHIGEELPGKLLGNIVASGQFVSSTTTRFCFTLGFPDPGKYRVGINLERIRTGQDDDSWLNVKSEEITVTSFKQDPNQDSEGMNSEGMNSEGMNLVPLHCREADDIEYTYTELSPWKTSISPPPKVVLGDITYYKHTVYIQEAEILGVETYLYAEPELSTGGFSDYGEGLFTKDGKWYEIDEDEERPQVMREEDKILDGDDGRKYRKGIGCLRWNYVGLRREVVTIDTVRHIAHLVLVCSGKYWNGDHRSTVALSLDGTKIASASADKTLNIWDTDTGALLLTLEGHTDAVFSVAFSPDGTKIASASADKTLKIWDTDTGALLLTHEGHTDAVFSVAFSPDGTKIASASAKKTLNIWDTNAGALLLTLEGHTDAVFSVAFSPDGTKIASASADKTLKIWDTDTGALLLTLEGHTDGSVAFSPDGTKIASALEDKTLNISDTTTGALVARLENHTCKARLPVFSPDSILLAFSSHEGMWLWDYATDATPRTLLGNSGKSLEAETMTFSRDGKELISASLDMDLWRWDTTTSLQLSWKNLISPIADIELLQPPPEKALPILLQPNKSTLSKRPSDGDIGGDLRNEEVRKRMEERNAEWQRLRNLYPDLDPTTAQILEETRNAMDNEWLALVEKLKETKDSWDSQKTIKELLKSINQFGLNLQGVERERKRMIYSSQGQSTTVNQDRLFDLKLLLEKLEQLQNCDSEDIMKKLKEARSAIPDATSSQGGPTPLNSRTTGAPAHKHELETQLERRIGTQADREERRLSLQEAINKVLIWQESISTRARIPTDSFNKESSDMQKSWAVDAELPTKDSNDQPPNQVSTGEGDIPRFTDSLMLLRCREEDDKEYTYDGYFPWKVRKSPVKVAGGYYVKNELLIPEAKILSLDLYSAPQSCEVDGIFEWGEGLYSDEVGNWYCMCQDEERLADVDEEDEIWEEGSWKEGSWKYSQTTGLFRGLWVRLRREVVVADDVRYIAHFVLTAPTRQVAHQAPPPTVDRDSSTTDANGREITLDKSTRHAQC